MIASLYERESALAQLATHAERARRRDGCLLLVTGEAGIGKTALIRHFIDSDDELSLVCGYGEPTSTARPLGVVHNLAASLPGALRKRLEQSVQAWQLYEALLEDLEKLPALPLIWIEDVHWADQATVEMLRYLARRCSTLRLMVIVTLRQDDLRSEATRDALLNGVPLDQWHEIHLERLSRSTVEKLASESGRDGAAMYQLTKGNPFFLSSTLRWARDSVPDSLVRLARQKLADLDSATATLIRLLSVHPFRIERALLRGIAPATPAAMAVCVEQGWLIASDDHFLFEHELLRRAVLDSIAPNERIQLHLVMLEQPLSLAQGVHHALKANDWPRLLRLAPQAADESMRSKSFREAVSYWQIALNHTNPPAQTRAYWLDQLGWAHVRAAENPSARIVLNQARQLWLALGDSDGILRNMSNTLRWPQRVRIAIPIFSIDDIEQALRLPPKPEQAFDRALLLIELSRRASQDEEFDQSRLLLDQAKDLITRVHATEDRIELRWWVCWIEAYYLREPPADNLDEIIALSIHLDLDHFSVQAQVLGSLFALWRGDFDDLERRVLDGLAYCEKRDLTIAMTLFKLSRAYMLLQTGRFEDLLVTVDEISSQMSMLPPTDQIIKIMLALVFARIGRQYETAGLDDSLALLRKDGNTAAKVWALIARAEICWLDGDQNSAGQHALEISRLFKKMKGSRSLNLLTGSLGGSNPRILIESGGATGDGGQLTDAGRLELLKRMPYEAALSLAYGDAKARKQAIAILQKCNAVGTIARLREDWANAGDGNVPRGANTSTKVNPGGLTRRELHILLVLATGLNNAEIAHQLKRSTRTVEHHLSSILSKTGLKSRHEVIAWAKRQQLI